MNTGGLILVIGSLLSATAAFIWLAYKLNNQSPKAITTKSGAAVPTGQALAQSAQTDVEHIFNEEFREELRNRGRLHFEKIIGENAMFLQQDLRETTTQLNEYMRNEITRTLQDEFKKYQQSITDAKQLAIDSIEKTVETIEQQRAALQAQMQTQAEAQRAVILERFEKNMGSVINHYIMQAIGNQIDLSDQLDFILAELENNKQAIIEDVKRGS